MSSYIVRRIAQMFLLIIGISVISFSIMHLAPGDPVSMLTDRTATFEEKEHARALYGLDKPIYVQYWVWLTKTLKGDFGKSFVTGKPVLTMIFDRMPATIYLNIFGITLIYAIAIPVGVYAALRQYSVFDHTVTSLTFLGQAMPSFWLGMLLILGIGMNFPFFKFAGMASYGIEWGSSPFFVVIVDRIRYLLLPLTVFVLTGMAGITRYMRANMLEVIRQDYVRTARAKGLSEKVVIYKHALRNALLPIITFLGFEIPLIFSGSVIIETLFAWPGVGLMGLQAVFQRDYMVIMAFNFIGASLTVLGTFIADMLYVVVDPRIKYN